MRSGYLKLFPIVVLFGLFASQLLFWSNTYAQYGTFLHYIKVDFFDCDDPTTRSNKLYFELDENEERTICFEAKNTFKESLDVGIHFVDGGLSNGSRVCHSASRKELFGQYLEGHDDQIRLGPSESYKGKTTLQFPQGYVGQVMGCLMYNVVDEQSGGMFEIIVGRTKFIDVFVKGDLVLDLQYSAPDRAENLVEHDVLNIRKMKKDEVSISMMISNEGNVAQDIVLKGSLKPMIGPAIEFTPQIHYLQGKESVETTFVATIPWHKGPFSVEIEAENTANFLFDNEQITNAMRETEKQTFTASFFLFPWWIVLLLGLIFLIIRLIMMLSRKHKQKKLAEIERMKQMYQQMYQQQPAPYPGGFLQNQKGGYPQQQMQQTGYQQAPNYQQNIQVPIQSQSQQATQNQQIATQSTMQSQTNMANPQSTQTTQNPATNPPNS